MVTQNDTAEINEEYIEAIVSELEDYRNELEICNNNIEDLILNILSEGDLKPDNIAVYSDVGEFIVMDADPVKLEQMSNLLNDIDDLDIKDNRGYTGSVTFHLPIY